MSAAKGFFQHSSPFVRIELTGNSAPLTALVDTGFNGELMLPERVVDETGLAQMGTAECMTASGDVVSVGVYTGSIRWIDRDVKARILATRGETVLLGMGLLKNCRMTMELSSEVLTIERVQDIAGS